MPALSVDSPDHTGEDPGHCGQGAQGARGVGHRCKSGALRVQDLIGTTGGGGEVRNSV